MKKYEKIGRAKNETKFKNNHRFWIGMMILEGCVREVPHVRPNRMKVKIAGSSSAPYRIASVEDLWLMREKLDKHFELTKDLDLSVVEEPEGFSPLGIRRNHLQVIGS